MTLRRGRLRLFIERKRVEKGKACDKHRADSKMDTHECHCRRAVRESAGSDHRNCECGASDEWPPSCGFATTDHQSMNSPCRQTTNQRRNDDICRTDHTRAIPAIDNRFDTNEPGNTPNQKSGQDCDGNHTQALWESCIEHRDIHLSARHDSCGIPHPNVQKVIFEPHVRKQTAIPPEFRSISDRKRLAIKCLHVPCQFSMRRVIRVPLWKDTSCRNTFEEVVGLRRPIL